VGFQEVAVSSIVATTTGGKKYRELFYTHCSGGQIVGSVLLWNVYVGAALSVWIIYGPTPYIHDR
jgi:predicted N-acetyltransferase YhbS